MDFQGVTARVAEIRGSIADAVQRGGHGQTVRIVAVTKTHGPEAVLAAAAAGITDVGENKVQEALGKQEALTAAGTMPAGMRWHLIGHLQTNKVKALPHFGLFHAMDRAKLANEISALGAKLAREIDVLFQVNVVGEDTKGGYAPSDVAAEAERLRAMPGLRIRGVMTMAPFDAPESVLREVFRGARAARDVLRAAGHPAEELSMGMSGDYLIAVEEGATMVRLGTVLFGARGG
ncbi:MAG TPA: YggS family pyridoxal phosphate-dependent enzyme [Gemmatimonadaceae bacterium]|nr:YggS family pyridoxal phosphate-dependent enzyme [Gemmatimonadaceae bacterium]